MYRICENNHVFKLPKSTRKYVEKYNTTLSCPKCNSTAIGEISKQEFEKNKNSAYSFME